MGKSKNIQDQQKLNQEFQDYVKKISEDMEVRQEKMSTTLEEMEKKHYEKYSDKALLMEGKYSHLTTVSEWSLKSISDIIDTCSKAIFGSKTPAGSEKKDTGKEVSASILAIKEREQYIANAAFDIVQAIVGGFKDTTSTSVEQKLDGKPIAPGMTLFIGVENNAYSSAKFFSNEKIIQTIFVFKVCYSIKEGQAQSALSDLQLYEDQKAIFRKKIEQLNDQIDRLDVTDENYEKEFTKLMNRAELMNNRMEAITEKIKKLSAEKIMEDQIICNQIVERIRMSRMLMSRSNDVYLVAATEFTYPGGSEKARTKIQQWKPKGVWLQSLETTDYVGNHYKATFGSNSEITQEMADGWIRTALGREKGFYFDE